MNRLLKLSRLGEALSMSGSNCRFCHSLLTHTFVDLGMSPLCQTHITPEQLNHMEPFYPLHTYICDQCLLVQLPEFVSPAEIFTEYAYFSSYVDALLKNASDYADLMVERFQFGPHSQVAEIASNDGYLLQYFQQKQIPVLGIEPAVNVSQVAKDKGIPVVNQFFGVQTATELAAERGQVDLLLGNNVLAHVPDINDFVGGMKIFLKPDGVITMEFPHLMQLMQDNLFDTIYHEHFSYLSLLVVEKIFAFHGLTLFDVQEIDIHGGSIRIFARHTEDGSKPVTDRIAAFRDREIAFGLDQLGTYSNFTEQVKKTKRNLMEFLITAKQKGKTIAGYGAPGKGNTLLNYCGIRTDFLDYTVDRNPYKQGKYTPGTHIPILDPEQIRLTKPDYLLILPWNVKDEIMNQVSYIREWGGQFVVPIPEVKVYS
jgi:SAM-dependent methyltransferase